MAMNAVLGTAEPLVSILQELDVKTLLLARRVSRQWLDTVQSSPELQEILYYRHRPKAREDTQYLWNRVKSVLEPLSPNDLAADLAPILLISINLLFIDERFHYLVRSGCSSFDPGQRVRCLSIKELLSSPYGSWQSMLLSQPPVTRVLIQGVVQVYLDPSITLRNTSRNTTRNAGRRTAGHTYDFVLSDPTGVKMSQVVAGLLSIAHELGGGMEDLSDPILNPWQLTFPGHIDLSVEQSLHPRVL
jgi:hypothetical protein